MSWSISAVGKSDSLVVKVAKEFENIKYLKEPENAVKNAAAVLVDQSLRAQIPRCAVKVSCAGSMSVTSQKDGPDSVTNYLKIDIEPIHGFVFE